MEMVMLDLMESEKLNILFLLLEPVNRGFSSQLSQLRGAVCFSTQTVYLSNGDDLPRGKTPLFHLALCSSKNKEG